MALDSKAILAKPREVPWRNLLTAFPEGMNFADALEHAGLNYEVAFDEVRMAKSGRIIPNKRATYRTDTGDPLGVVGSKYNIVQNKDAFGFLQAVLDSGDLKPIGGGYFKGGSRPWIQTRLPDDVVIAGDQHIPLVFCANSHDGGLPVTVALSAIRVVCENTYSANTKAPRRFVVRHLFSADARIAEARRVLDISFKYFEEYKIQMERLAEQPISDEQFKDVVERLFPLPANANALTEDQREAIGRKRAQMLGVYQSSPLVPRGNKYGALQAVTEWADHVKNGQRGDARAKAERKTEWVLLGDGVEFKDKALALIEAAR